MFVSMSIRERCLRVLRGQPTDRVPIRLWGVDPFVPAPRAAWQPLHDLVSEFGLDNILHFSGEWPASRTETSCETRDTGSPDWYEQTVTVKAPAGDLTRISRQSRSGRPGYTTKHPIETVEDARRWLSLPEDDLPDASAFSHRVAEVGDQALVMAGLREPMYTVNDATGSEVWGYWLHDERDLLHEMVAKAAKREHAIVRKYLDQGVGPLFGWVGPELCIPPLASPADFDDFVTRYDRPMIDTIHDAGGLVWIHCHGDMNPVLERFARMGLDCLNPIEPPPVGRLTLADAKRRVGDRMTLEGGIEVGDFQLLEPDELAARAEHVMAMGRPGGRFILCPSSDHTHWPDMSEKIVSNYRVFVETALRCAAYE